MTQDEKFMRAAIAQARKAEKLDEVPIGCVIVYEGKIIARGYNRRNTDSNTLSHAELNAIRKASKKLGDWRLEGCTIYITLEPCQMCAGAIVQARITRAVIGSMNAKAGCAGSVLNILQMDQFNHRVDVTRGVLKEECSEMLSAFFRNLRLRKKQTVKNQMQEENREESSAMKYTTIIFDMDGTLLNTLEDIGDSAIHSLKMYGQPERSYEDVKKVIGNGAAMLIEGLIEGGKENPLFEQVLAEHKKFYPANSEIKTRPYDGILELLDALKEKGIRVAIVSNKRDTIVKTLNTKYFGDRISIAIGDQEGLQHKPAGDLVWKAMKELGSTPEECLYVGDTEVDYETCKNAGCDCMLVTWGFRTEEQLEQFQVAYKIAQPGDLLNVLGLS